MTTKFKVPVKQQRKLPWDRGDPKSKDRLHEVSLKEIAAELGLTVERTRQIEIAALRKVRTALEARGFTCARDLLPED